MMKKGIVLLSLIVVSVTLGIIIDRVYLQQGLQFIGAGGDAYQIRQGGYSLINPLLECEIGEKTLSKQFISFRYTLEDQVKQLESDSEIDNISVYFRNLNNGAGIGVHEKENFSPASLLKIPIMIAYYKQYESSPEIFKKKLTHDSLIDQNQIETIRPPTSMKVGERYSVEDLIYRMIAFSDNNAMVLLVKNLPLPLQDKVFTDLGITIPGVRGTEDYMSVIDNASFFRILYNASYLEKSTSQKALELLTRSGFSDGIRGGVPKGIRVANKFGERLFNGKQQLHDCGIVYFKNNPYLLCVMSRGTNFNKLASSIRQISRIVYTEVQKQEEQ